MHERYETREDKSEKDFSYGLRFASKMVLAPLLATSFESLVSNKAEGIRFYGPEKYFKLEGKGFGNVLHKITGPAVSVFFNPPIHVSNYRYIPRQPRSLKHTF